MAAGLERLTVGDGAITVIDTVEETLVKSESESKSGLCADSSNVRNSLTILTVTPPAVQLRSQVQNFTNSADRAISPPVPGSGVVGVVVLT